ncbi:ADP-ribosylglycohydrolase family protein [Paramuribaculum intestinale]|uniref:ADP-ribosylglycohydrolase family protein n=3 Tax=Paramuribaculum intestinale TaxID=2094151 RepID=UPI0032B2CC84
MLGAIAGDIIGSFFERSRVKFYDFDLFYPWSRFTDDSVMTLAVAQWLMPDSDRSPDRLVGIMQEFGREYPDAGYGYRFNQWLHSADPQPYGSWGNGSAMRVSPAGIVASTLDEALGLARISASVTHNHPAGIAGAQAVAAAIWMARRGASKGEIRDYIQWHFNYDLTRTIEEIRPDYRWDVSCQGSVPESIIAFLDGRDFEDTVRLAVSLGGDTDTMACIAGSIAACVYPIPREIALRCEEILAPGLLATLRDFERATGPD